jgi:hypothetical protein
MAARLLERSVRLPLCKAHVLSVRRGYRADSFGFREPAQVQLPDCEFNIALRSINRY